MICQCGKETKYKKCESCRGKEKIESRQIEKKYCLYCGNEIKLNKNNSQTINYYKIKKTCSKYCQIKQYQLSRKINEIDKLKEKWNELINSYKDNRIDIKEI